MTTIKLELTMTLETEDGRSLNGEQAIGAYEDAKHAIRWRLFGSGFLPDHIYVEGWDVRHVSTMEV